MQKEKTGLAWLKFETDYKHARGEIDIINILDKLRTQAWDAEIITETGLSWKKHEHISNKPIWIVGSSPGKSWQQVIWFCSNQKRSILHDIQLIMYNIYTHR